MLNNIINFSKQQNTLSSDFSILETKKPFIYYLFLSDFPGVF